MANVNPLCARFLNSVIGAFELGRKCAVCPMPDRVCAAHLGDLPHKTKRPNIA